jgi:hypothetical protein
MIDHLTENQTALFPVYVDKWLKIGLNTDPVDLENAKAAVCKAYSLVGLKEPTQFYVVDSPMAAIDFIRKLNPKLSKIDVLNSMIYGSNDAYWLSYYDYMKNVLGVKNLEKIEGLSELAKYSGWLNVYEDVVVFQHRPAEIKFDEQNRLHCQDNPAIRYRDGYSIYAWHGTRVPAEWITDPLSLSAKTALTWDNLEQRRCACEILGWNKILQELDAVTIDKDGDPEIGELVEVNIPDIGTERFLRVLCGTGREFALPVPPEMKTALEANAWTFGLDPEELLNLEVRT